MLKTTLKLLIGLVLVLAGQVCAPVGQDTPVPGAVDTAIVETIEALTLTAGPGIPVTGPDTPTPTLTSIPPTASATSTQIPVFTLTPVRVTPSASEISVSVPTNCRVGPGRAYERTGALLVGEVAEVVGRNAAGTYWIIENPDGPGTCWLWGRYVTLAGNTSALYSNDFSNLTGCNETETRDDLEFDDIDIVSSPAFDFDLAGRDLRAIVTLCSEPEQSGTCVTKAISFTP